MDAGGDAWTRVVSAGSVTFHGTPGKADGGAPSKDDEDLVELISAPLDVPGDLLPSDELRATGSLQLDTVIPGLAGKLHPFCYALFYLGAVDRPLKAEEVKFHYRPADAYPPS